MLKDVTLGQFFPGSTPIHRLDPRTKLVLVIVYIVALFLAKWFVSYVVVAAFLLYYNKIFAVTFDEDFAKAVGTKADLYNLLIAVIVAVVIVLAMNLVGSLLISALVIFPALSAMRLFQNFRSVTVCSAVLSVSCAVLGILVSILAGTPVGSTIVAADILAFLVCSALGRARGGETG